MSNGTEVLERVAQAGGRLLRVEREPAPGPGGALRSRRLRLTFDVGAVELRAAPEGLAAGDGGDRPGLLGADEDEPWWTVIGNPLTRVAPHEERGCLVQFRQDEASPKLMILVPDGDTVEVRVVI